MTGREAHALWYLSRGTGVVALVLVTASLALGLLEAARVERPLPRFVVAGLHRNLSLLTLCFVGAHVATSVLDPFAAIRWADAVVPLEAAYRPFWLGLGALALDLVAALVVTSLLRVRLGYRRWRAVHWLAYACWPVALLHALGTGSDVHAPWLLATTFACVAVVAAAAWCRVRAAQPPQELRRAALAATVAAPLALVLWLAQGPLAPGWARRSGTPPRLLHTPQARPAPDARHR